MNLLLNLLAPMVYVATGLISLPLALWLVRAELKA